MKSDGGHSHKLKVLPYRLLINYKGKLYLHSVETMQTLPQPGDHNITNDETKWHFMPPDMTHWETQSIAYVIIFANNIYPKSFHEETSNKSKIEGLFAK